ncbi:hypothetical protein ES703_11676 [subsurface metagenome]
MLLIWLLLDDVKSWFGGDLKNKGRCKFALTPPYVFLDSVVKESLSLKEI